jgi:hypothetical protein
LERLSSNSDNREKSGRPGARIIDVTFVAATPQAINHGCASARVYFTVARLDADATIWQTAVDDRQITLQASANCNASLEIWSN